FFHLPFDAGPVRRGNVQLAVEVVHQDALRLAFPPAASSPLTARWNPDHKDELAAENGKCR
ncbi:MAG: hypothetical protein MUF20_02160, partial [Methylotetracoccus sp.]|nr:hypothetical protein [Methylotetracoccus sp.]